MLAHIDRHDHQNHHDHGQKHDLAALLDLRPRHVSPEQRRLFEGYIAEILAAYGLDLESEGARDTPTRFLRALYDATSGYEGDAKLSTVFAAECRAAPGCQLSQVVEGPIALYALCEHHALPFYGRAFVGYISDERIIGISKLTRMVRLFARRFTVQERIGEQLADTLHALLEPQGVAVYLEAHHMCTQMRGVQETASLTRTTAWRGVYAAEPALRAEFLSLCGAHAGVGA